MKTNLKQKTQDYLKKKGAIVWNVECFNKHSKKSKDLFNLFDVLMIYKQSIWGIQITDGSHFAQHHKKMIENNTLYHWLNTDQRAMLMAWNRKKIKKGGVKYKWV